VSAYRKLKPAQRRFVDLIVQGKKGTEAMREIRPHLKRPEVLASKWRALPEVQAAIEEREEEAIREAGITSFLILQELGRVARFDPARLFAEDGSLKPIHELDENTRAAIASIEVEELGADREEQAQFRRLRKVRHWNKVEALKLLGQYRRLFAERHEHSAPGGGPIQLTHRHELTDEQLLEIASRGRRGQEA